MGDDDAKKKEDDDAKKKEEDDVKKKEEDDAKKKEEDDAKKNEKKDEGGDEEDEDLEYKNDNFPTPQLIDLEETTKNLTVLKGKAASVVTQKDLDEVLKGIDDVKKKEEDD